MADSAVQPRASSFLPREISPPQSTQPSTNSAITSESQAQTQFSGSQLHIHSTSNTISSTQQKLHKDNLNSLATLPKDKMPLSIGSRRSSGAAENNGSRKTLSEGQLARNLANTNAVTTYEAGLNSKDRAVQREAVKRYLADKVKSDWTWPSVTAPR